MYAVCLQKPGAINLQEVPAAMRRPGEILIAVRSVGVCGSDIGAYRGTNPLVSYPRIIGHEIAGEVVEVEVTEPEFVVGDRVVLEPYKFCGECYPCSIGRTNCCERLNVLGVHVDGGMAEYISHPRHLLHKAPAGVPWELLPLAEPLVVSMQAVSRPRTKAGEHVVITGAGPIGLLAAQYVRVLGAIPIVLDPVAERLALAQRLGVEHVVNPTAADAVAAISRITNGRMAEVVIEASGAEGAIRGSFDYVAYAGRISLVGWPKHEISLPTALITNKELDLVGSRNSAGLFMQSLALIASQQINVAELVSLTVSAQALPASVAAISEHPEQYLKVIGLFNG